MKNFALYYQIKRLQCLVLPTLFFFMALLIFDKIEVSKNPFNAIIAVIAILIGYYYLLQEVENWDDWLDILMPTIFCLCGIILSLYLIGIYFTQQTTIDEQINNWILTHIGKYFSDCCLLIISIILFLMTPFKIMPAITPFNNICETNWYLENDAPNSEKGEAWIFYKNGKLIITSPLKESKEISHVYVWKYNPQMKSIILLSEERTQVFSNFNVQNFYNYQSLSFTTNQPNSLYQFSSMKPQIVNMTEEDNDSDYDGESEDENQCNESIEMQEDR